MERMNKGGEEVGVSLDRVGGRDPAHVEIGVLVELDPAGRFSHRVADILVSADRKGLQLVGLAPV